MNKYDIRKFIKINWIIPFIIIKSFFLAITQLAWGLVSLGLLGWVVFFIRKEYPLVGLPDLTKFLDISVNFILNNINLFFWTFFIIYIYFEFKELRKLQK